MLMFHCNANDHDTAADGANCIAEPHERHYDGRMDFMRSVFQIHRVAEHGKVASSKPGSRPKVLRLVEMSASRRTFARTGAKRGRPRAPSGSVLRSGQRAGVLAAS